MDLNIDNACPTYTPRTETESLKKIWRDFRFPNKAMKKELKGFSKYVYDHKGIGFIPRVVVVLCAKFLFNEYYPNNLLEEIRFLAFIDWRMKALWDVWVDSYVFSPGTPSPSPLPNSPTFFPSGTPNGTPDVMPPDTPSPPPLPNPPPRLPSSPSFIFPESPRPLPWSPTTPLSPIPPLNLKRSNAFIGLCSEILDVSADGDATRETKATCLAEGDTMPLPDE